MPAYVEPFDIRVHLIERNNPKAVTECGGKWHQ